MCFFTQHKSSFAESVVGEFAFRHMDFFHGAYGMEFLCGDTNKKN